MKISLKENHLSKTFVMMCLINFIQISFIAFLIYFSSIHLLKHYQAGTFLSQINVIPMAYYKIPGIALLSFALLLWTMRYQSLCKDSLFKFNLFLVLEIGLCLMIMYVLSFSSNAVLLLVIANILANTRNRQLQGTMLIMMIVLYLATTQDVVMNFIQVTNFQHYLNIYNKEIHVFFASCNSILSTLSMISFMIFIALIIQKQINESQKITKLNQELQELNLQLEEMADMREKMGETRERNRLAREIHDTLGHTLTGLSVGLEACNALIEVDKEKTKQQLVLLSSLARDGLKDVRHSVNKLRPDALQNRPLKEALLDMVEDFSKATGVQVNFFCHLTSLDFQKDEEDTIYRIIQEGMTNALRHGYAKHIFISFAKDEHQLVIIIEDDGIGCLSIQEGFGLHHMRERVNLLKGKMRCYSNQGFQLIVELPIRKEQNNG